SPGSAHPGRDRRRRAKCRRAQGNSGGHHRRHRRRSGPLGGIVLQLLRLQGSDGPPVGPALPRRGQPAGAFGHPARPDQSGAGPRGRRRALAYLPQPARRGDQRVAAGDGQRRLRAVLGTDVRDPNLIHRRVGAARSGRGLLPRGRPAADRRGDRGDVQPVLLYPAQRAQPEGRHGRRRGLHQDPRQHLLPSHLQPGGSLQLSSQAPTPGVIREFVGLPSPTAGRAGAGGHPCQGLYHRGVGRKPKVAMIATHYQIDFSEHYLADYMATRGIGFLGWNTRYRGYESSFLLDHALVDIGVGMRWLREIQGVETIVLLGNSGGGSLMAAYQAQAVDPQVTPLEGMRPAAGLTDLPPADGYVASAAHPGRPDVLTAWMDASVVDENDPIAS